MDNEALKEGLGEENVDVAGGDSGTITGGNGPRSGGGTPPAQQRALYTGLGIVLLVGLVLLAVALLGNNKGGTVGTPVVIPSVGVLLTPPAQLDPKLASVLTNLQSVYLRDGEAKAREFALNNKLMDPSGRVNLTIEMDTADVAAQDELVNQLGVLGVKIDNRYSQSLDVSFTLEQLGKALEIPTVGAGTPIALPTSIDPNNLPPTLLQKLTDLKHVAQVRLPRSPSPQGEFLIPQLAGPEGVKVVHADQWQAQGITGKGMKIGILDVGGFLGYKAMLGQELPANVVVKSFNRSGDIEGNPGADDGDRVHGTACAEIIHAMAPDAQLYFAAFDTDEENAIKWLVSQGVTVISASYGGHYYPTDGKHNPAIPIINSTHDQGIFWSISSGNEREDHYKGTFKQGSDGLNVFYNGSNVLGFQANAGTVQIILRWNDWDDSTVDYDLYLLDSNYNKLSTSADVQSGPPADPVEIIKFQLPQSGQYYISIGGKAGVRAVDYDLFVRGPVKLDKSVASGSLGSPGDATGALTVGAVTWNQTTIAEYSSEGPSDDGRLKPEISAPSGVTSRSYGKFGEVFDGTSASAPFVAGAAALVWNANPKMKPDDVRNFLLQHAKDLGDPGVDNTFGYGLLDLGSAPNSVSPQLPTTAPNAPTQEIPTVQPTLASLAPTPGVQPTAAALPPSSSGSDSGGNGVLWMAVAGGGMVGLSLIIGAVLLVVSRRGKSKYGPPGGYSGPPPYGGGYPPQPGQGYYPGPGGQAPQPNRPPQYGSPQAPPHPQYGQTPPVYPQQQAGQQQGYTPQYPQPQAQPPQPQYGQQYPPQPQQPQQQPQMPPQPPAYGQPAHPNQGYPIAGQGQTPQQQPGIAPQSGNMGQGGYPPQPSYQPPATQPPGPVPGMPVQAPPPPQGGYPVPGQSQQYAPPPMGQPGPPPQGHGGRPMPPPPKGMAQCPNCGRVLAPNAVQCDNCGWRKP